MLLSHVEGSTHMKNLRHHVQRRQFDAIDQVAPRLRAAHVLALAQRQDVSRFAAAIEGAVKAGQLPGEPDEELQARVARRTTGGGSTNGGRAAVGSGRGPSGEAGHSRGNRSRGGHLQVGGATTTAKPVAATETTVVGLPAVAVTGEAAGRFTSTPAVVTAAAVAGRAAVLTLREAA